MGQITTRTGKGAALSYGEMDANLNSLNANVLDTIMVTPSVTLGTQANAEQELGNTNGFSQILLPTLNLFNRIRLSGRVATLSASANNPRLYPQYSLNGSTWITIGTGLTTNSLPLSATGLVATAWIALPTAAQAETVYFRIAQNGGDATASPIIRGVCYQFGFA